MPGPHIRSLKHSLGRTLGKGLEDIQDKYESGENGNFPRPGTPQAFDRKNRTAACDLFLRPEHQMGQTSICGNSRRASPHHA